jgi:hypothetical protein
LRVVVPPLVPTLPIAAAFEAAYLEQWRILPLERTDHRLVVAAVGTPEPEVLDDLERTYEVLVWRVGGAAFARAHGERQGHHALRGARVPQRDAEKIVTVDGVTFAAALRGTLQAVAAPAHTPG